MSEASIIVPAYVDEAGARGLDRNLTQDRDNEVSLMCAVIFEPSKHLEYTEMFRKPFEEFRAAMPAGSKLHITDAFKNGNDEWRNVAEKIRVEYLEMILNVARPCIVFSARRLRLQREAHIRHETLIAEARKAKTSPVKIVGDNRPSDKLVEDEVIQYLSLLLDAFAQDMASQLHRVQQVDLLFDEIDVAERYEAIIQRTREISRNVTTVKGWDPTQNKRMEGAISFSVEAPYRVDTQFVGGIHVVGKEHPLVLAADIVANHLHHHLSHLPPHAPLNAPSSVEGWILRERVWGVMEEASIDLY